MAVQAAQLRTFSHTAVDPRRLTMSETDLAEDFHEASKLRASMPAAVLGPAGSFFMTVDQAPFRLGRPGLSRTGPAIMLRRPATLPIDLVDVTRRRRSELPTNPHPIGQDELGAVLGVSAACREDDRRFRHHPSAGALYPLDTVVIASATDSLPSGGYLYDPASHGLHARASIDAIGVRSSLERSGMPRAAVLLALVATFARTRAKYGLRGYRFALTEAGHLAQAIITAATALGMPALPWGGFVDDEIDRALDLDGVDRSCLYVLGLAGAGQQDR
jgi:SagB-type dehydrogenase family enzyme